LRQRDAVHTFGEIFRTVRPALYSSFTDPAAAWTNKRQIKVGFAYGTNYLIDLHRAMIIDIEATPARWTAKVAATKTMLELTCRGNCVGGGESSGCCGWDRRTTMPALVIRDDISLGELHWHRRRESNEQVSTA
jgi:hypothetical protein